MWTSEDEAFMQRALDVAERGRGRVAPNPLVGCVLVKDGEVIAEGWHDHLGGLHAEQMAIHDAESKGKSSGLFLAKLRKLLGLLKCSGLSYSFC